MNLAPTPLSIQTFCQASGPRFGSQFRIDIDPNVQPYSANSLLSNVASAVHPGLASSGDDSFWIKGDRPYITGNFDGSSIMAMSYRDHADIFCLDSKDKEVTANLKTLLARNPYGGSTNDGKAIGALKTVITFKKVPKTHFTDTAALKQGFYQHALQTVYDKFKAKLDATFYQARGTLTGLPNYFNAVVSLESQMTQYFAELGYKAREPR